MKRISVILILFLFYTINLFCQSSKNDQAALSKIITEQANQMAGLFKSVDYNGYIKWLLPVFVKAAGGETKMLELLNTQAAELKSKNAVVNGIVFSEPSEIIKVKDELQCTIAQQTELKSAKARVITYSTLIAISTDNGKTWKFMNASSMDITIVRKLLPNLSQKITLPPKQKPSVYPL